MKYEPLNIGKEKPYPGREDDFQRTCIEWLKWQFPNCLYFHVPNGGKRNRTEAALFKAMGVRPGVADLIFLEPNLQKNGLVVELKAKGGKLQESQLQFLEFAEDRNFYAVVVWNFDGFKKLVTDYFNNTFFYHQTTVL